MKISDISIRRPVFATMMIGALLVIGMFSYTTLPVDLYPEVDFPFTVVSTVYPGASAESVETEVSKKIEEAVNEISGVRHITARSREGYSIVFVEFLLERDGAEATQEVRDKVAGIRQDLPEEIEEPVVGQYDHDAMPVISATVSGRRSLREITELAKNKIKEGLPMCLKTMEIYKWGKKGRVSSCLKILRSYGPAAAKTILPELRELEKDMLKHSEARSVLKDALKQIREIIEEAEKATGRPDFVPLKDFLPIPKKGQSEDEQKQNDR